MNNAELAVMHETLGNEYLDVLRGHGIFEPPGVMWLTSPAPESRTVAFIIWGDAEDEVIEGFPRKVLAFEAVRRVLVRLCAN